MKISRATYVVGLLALANPWAGSLWAQTPLGTAFTYQGQLKSGGSPANGSFNMDFKLYPVPAGGTLLASQTLPGVSVADGLFTVQVDFGAGVFDGNQRWLDVAVNGTPLVPRQELTAAPYAIRALNATQLNGQPASFYQNASNLSSGTIPDARLAGTYSGALSLSNAGNTFTGTFFGSGAGLTGLNAGNISQGLVPSTFGGTGLNTSAASPGSLLYTSGVGSWSLLPPGTNSQVLTLSGGVPTWNSASGLTLPYSGSAGVSFPDAAFKVTNNGSGYALAAQTGTGAFGFAHTDGARTMASYVDSTNGWFGMRSNHPLKLMTNNTVVMVLDSGRVGIGTLSPANNLSVAGQADFASNVGIGTTTPTTQLDVRGYLTLDAGGDAALMTGTAAVEQNRYLSLFNSLLLTSASGLKAGGVLVSDSYSYANPGKNDLIVKGNIGVGTAAPSQKLHVVGNIQASGSVFASCGTLSCSDERFKTHIEPMSGALSLVERLRAVHFDWCREEFPDRQFGDQRQVGLIAQEVERVLPDVVAQDSEGYYSIDYGRLTPVLVQAVKEQQRQIESTRGETDARINALRAENAELKARLEKLESMIGATHRTNGGAR